MAVCLPIVMLHTLLTLPYGSEPILSLLAALLFWLTEGLKALPPSYYATNRVTQYCSALILRT